MYQEGREWILVSVSNDSTGLTFNRIGGGVGFLFFFLKMFAFLNSTRFAIKTRSNVLPTPLASFFVPLPLEKPSQPPTTHLRAREARLILQH